MRGLVIAHCIACEWIGLLLLRLLVVFYKHMENTDGKDSLMTWAAILEPLRQVKSRKIKYLLAVR
jgi:hypothetical protein